MKNKCSCWGEPAILTLFSLNYQDRIEKPLLLVTSGMESILLSSGYVIWLFPNTDRNAASPAPSSHAAVGGSAASTWRGATMGTPCCKEGWPGQRFFLSLFVLVQVNFLQIIDTALLMTCQFLFSSVLSSLMAAFSLCSFPAFHI